jgi:transposase
MKQHSIVKQDFKGGTKRPRQPITVGIDLGDRSSRYCVVDAEGEVVQEGSTATTPKGLAQVFGARPRCRIALEVGAHSRWVSRLLKELGHEVIVANPRQLRLITQSSRKSDRMDARMLAKLARVDPELLRPIRHRGEAAQRDLMVVRVREALLEARTRLVNTARGLVKSTGERLPACDADTLGPARLEALPESLREILKPLLEEVETLTGRIKALDGQLEQIARTRYPETHILQQIKGVGTLIALTFVLTLEEPDRFQKSRDVGCYVGLRPKRSESGESQPQLRITKEGDTYLRKMLVQGAHYILGYRGPDTDLRRWGLHLAERGGKNAKKRAIVAVARKLAILLHRLWVTGEVYEPLRNSQAGSRLKQAAA